LEIGFSRDPRLQRPVPEEGSHRALRLRAEQTPQLRQTCLDKLVPVVLPDLGGNPVKPKIAPGWPDWGLASWSSINGPLRLIASPESPSLRQKGSS